MTWMLRLVLFVIAAAALAVAGAQPGMAGAPPKAEAKSKPVGDERFILVDNITTSVFSGGLVLGSIRADIVIDVSQPREREKVQALVPRLRARAHRVMQDYANREYRAGDTLNADGLRAGFQRETDTLLGEGVGRVYLTFLILHGG